MSSERAVFITYSSALLMRVMELRRRQGTRNMPFLPVAIVSPFENFETSSLFGVQGRICILSRRGRMFRRIWRDKGSEDNPVANRSMSTPNYFFFPKEPRFRQATVSPFGLCLSLCECSGFSGKRWGLSHSSWRPSWSPTSQTSNTCSQRFVNHMISFLISDQT